MRFCWVKTVYPRTKNGALGGQWQKRVCLTTIFLGIFGACLVDLFRKTASVPSSRA
jgi:hypothetical protein